MKRFRYIVLGVVAAGALVSCATQPRDLGEQLEIDNPRVIRYLSSLSEGHKGKTLAGVRLSDGAMALDGARLVDFAYLPGKRQHIYLFNTEYGYSAYVWIDKGGKSLNIPPDGTGESAHVLSGDIFTFTEMGPEDGLVVLSEATPGWFKRQMQ